MRIFEVITVSEYGGAQTVVANLIKNLNPEHEVFVLYGGEGEAWSELGNNFTRIRLCGHRKKLSWKDLILFFKLLYYRLKYKPDIIHLHSSKMGVLGRLAFSKKKTVLTMHGFDSIRRAYPKFLILEQKLRNRAAQIVCVSNYDVESMREVGIKSNVMSIYNGVYDFFPRSKNIHDSISNSLETIKVKYPRIIMCIARISQQKKFDLFVDIAKNMPQYAFVWIGNKESVQGLPENVFCLGESPSAVMYLRYADLFILPSNYEGLPMSMLEALSFGVPVVASAVGGITEALDDKNGFAVPNRSYFFEDKIQLILTNSELHEQMSKYARESYLERFTIEHMVNEYKTVFNQIKEENK